MRQKLNLITLGVNNLKRSLEFYEQGLGWKKSSASQEGIAFFPLGGIVLSLYSRDELAKDAEIKSEGHGFQGFTISYNAKSELEVDEVMEKIRVLGGKIVKQAQKVFWGGYSGYFADPDGFLIEVAYNPFWPFDEKDNIILPE